MTPSKLTWPSARHDHARYCLHQHLATVGAICRVVPRAVRGAGAGCARGRGLQKKKKKKVARTQRPTLAQYDQVTAEVGSPPALDVGLLVGWLKQTNTNTMNFLLWDTDGHQYKDMVR